MTCCDNYSLSAFSKGTATATVGKESSANYINHTNKVWFTSEWIIGPEIAVSSITTVNVLFIFSLSN